MGVEVKLENFEMMTLFASTFGSVVMGLCVENEYEYDNVGKWMV